MKKAQVIVVLVLVIAIFSVWYFMPKRYSVSLDGVYYQLGQSEVIENIKVRLDGKLRHHINGKKTFKGVIAFEGKEVPQVPKDRTELLFHYHGDHFSPIFSGFRIVDASGIVAADIYSYGTIYVDKDFSQFAITVFKDGDQRTWSPSDGFMITAPAKDRKDARSITQARFKDIGMTIEG